MIEVEKGTAPARALPDDPPPPAPPHRARVAKWRFGRGWSEGERRRYLADLRGRPVNFSTPLEEMTPERGWTADGIEEEIGFERPGPPEEDGLFARVREAMTKYEFSDPRIVVGHFDPLAELRGREMLLEIKVLGLRYLGGVRVHSVREASDGDLTCFGYRYDTLEGHFERGFEWFLVTKDHRTGEVRFKIEAHWQTGQFPNWWSRVGFRLVGERFRERWRRRAVARLRRSATQPAEQPLAGAATGLNGQGRRLPGLPSDALAALSGAGIGLLGAGVQTMIGLLLDRLFLPNGEDNNIAPRLVMRSFQRLGYGENGPRDWALGTVFHFGYGAMWGAVLNVARARTGVPASVLAIPVGATIYGLAFSRAGVGTRTGTEQHPDLRLGRKQVSLMAVANAYAVATGLLLDLFSWWGLRTSGRRAVNGGATSGPGARLGARLGAGSAGQQAGQTSNGAVRDALESTREVAQAQV